MLKRIIMHWSAGGHNVSQLDKDHYHFIVSGSGEVVAGKHAPEDNISTRDGYAAHTRMCNTGSIGVAMAAMAGAGDSPFNPGLQPITETQLAAFVALVRGLAEKYGIPITRETVLSHAEVQPTLGIKQRGKWDIAWLPGMAKPGDPVEVGDKIRALVAGAEYVAPPEPSITSVILRRGSSGANVTILQERLNALGAGIDADGDFGPATENAVRKEQQENELDPDGVVGPNTWAALGFE